MKKNYTAYCKLFTGLILLSAVSCKKDKQAPQITNFATIGLYEQQVDATIKRVFVHITQLGDVTTDHLSVFDTGSTGMTMDANGIIPASAITSTGVTVAGDSTVYGGITVTPQQATITYGIIGSETREYGQLAYATVKIAGVNGSSVTTARIPFFLYYKVVNVQTGAVYPAHSNDVFGVGPGTSYTNNLIGSPLSYFKLGAGQTNGFKLGMFQIASFSTGNIATYVAGLLSIGLTQDDLTSSGFMMHPQVYFNVGGYSPNITGTLTYNNTTLPVTILFDTGNPSVSIIEDPNAASNMSTLPANTNVTISTPKGFTYSYTTSSTYNLTQVYKTSYSGDIRTIYSIDFFLGNEYLMDYTNHQIGLKNN